MERKLNGKELNGKEMCIHIWENSLLLIKGQIPVTCLQACSKYASKLLSFIPSREKITPKAGEGKLESTAGFCPLLLLATRGSR